ncbi:MAG: YgiQ family radical SAM protein [Clostridium sp.]
MAEFLPVSIKDMENRGWDELDFIYVSGDAYVDHPSFGHGIITRLLESLGFKVGIIAQPEWKTKDAFMKLGKPKLGFLVSSGNIDSMVNHYTTTKKRRHDDLYSPGGKSGYRPDRAVIVYCNRIREAYGNVPIIIGGIEASLRRFSHYDYWDDKVRNSILIDSSADLLIYGMGERPFIEIANLLGYGKSLKEIKHIRGTCHIEEDPLSIKDSILLPSYEEVSTNKKEYANSFKIQFEEQDAITGNSLIQKHGKKYIIQNPPSYPLVTAEMDMVYDFPYTRTFHPMYKDQGGIPALNEIEFSISSHRGCFGGCSFCALNFHQGRVIQSRSHESIISEAKKLTNLPKFKGYIHDIGGPTANFRKPSCKKQLKHGVCKTRQCLHPTPCKNLDADHSDYLTLLREVRSLPKIKKVFVRSGIRYDYLLCDKDPSFMNDLVEHHVSGQLKVAPEHVSDKVLKHMGKPQRKVYDTFTDNYFKTNEKLNLNQFLVPYLMSSHPGSDLTCAIELAEFIRDMGYNPEQVQDFYPTPGSLSTTMYYTGINPITNETLYIPKTPDEKAMQRALLQFRDPRNRKLVEKALKLANREDLLKGKDSLFTPFKSKDSRNNNKTSSKNKDTKIIDTQTPNIKDMNVKVNNKQTPRSKDAKINNSTSFKNKDTKTNTKQTPKNETNKKNKTQTSDLRVGDKTLNKDPSSRSKKRKFKK